MINTRYKENVPIDVLKKRIQDNEIIFLKGNKYDTLVGKGLQLKINSSVGLSDEHNLKKIVSNDL